MWGVVRLLARLAWRQLHWVAVVLVLVVAVWLRLMGLDQTPPGFYADEASYAVNAVSLLETQRDEWGVRWPVFLRAFDDYKPALVSYFQAGAFAVLGAKVAVARGVVAVISLVGLLGAYLIWHSRQSGWSGWWALAAVVVMALMPWYFHFSRVVLDPVVGLSFTLLGFGLWTRQRLGWRILGSVSLVLAMYTYNATRLMVPPLVGWWIWTWLHEGWQGPVTWTNARDFFQLSRAALISLGVWLVGAVLLVAVVVYSGAGKRAGDVAITTQAQFVEIEVETGLYAGRSLPLVVNRALHNKARVYFWKVAQQYGAHFSPSFLFFDNNLGSSRNGLPLHGVMLMAWLPWLLLGLKQWQWHSWSDRWWLGWLLLAPLPAALSADSPHAGRAILMAPALVYFAVQGWRWWWLEVGQQQWRYLVLVLGLAVVVIHQVVFIFDYFHRFEAYAVGDWQAEMAELVPTALELTSTHDQVWVSDRTEVPYVHFAWYGQLDSAQLQQQRVGVATEFVGVKFMHQDGPQPICILADESATALILHRDQLPAGLSFGEYPGQGRIDPFGVVVNTGLSATDKLALSQTGGCDVSGRN